MSRRLIKVLFAVAVTAAGGGVLSACNDYSPSFLSGGSVKFPTVTVGRIDKTSGSLVADLTLFNDNSFAVGSVEIGCVTLSADGTDLAKYRFSIFSAIPANSSQVFTKYKLGAWPREGHSVVCETVKATRA